MHGSAFAPSEPGCGKYRNASTGPTRLAIPTNSPGARIRVTGKFEVGQPEWSEVGALLLVSVVDHSAKVMFLSKRTFRKRTKSSALPQQRTEGEELRKESSEFHTILLFGDEH
jgi:hypothetical protein